jgi:hypothetical protein
MVLKKQILEGCWPLKGANKKLRHSWIKSRRYGKSMDRKKKERLRQRRIVKVQF